MKCTIDLAQNHALAFNVVAIPNIFAYTNVMLSVSKCAAFGVRLGPHGNIWSSFYGARRYHGGIHPAHWGSLFISHNSRAPVHVTVCGICMFLNDQKSATDRWTTTKTDRIRVGGTLIVNYFLPPLNVWEFWAMGRLYTGMHWMTVKICFLNIPKLNCLFLKASSVSILK